MTIEKNQIQESEAVQAYLSVLESGKESWDKRFFSEGTKKKKIFEIVSYICDKENIDSTEKAKEILTDEYIKSHYLNTLVKNAPRVPELLPSDHSDLFWIIHPEETPSFEELVQRLADDMANGRRNLFPQKYFSGAKARDKATICFRYLCENILRYDRKTIREVFDRSEGIKLLAKYKFRIILNCVYPSVSQLLVASYPDIYNEALDEQPEET